MTGTPGARRRPNRAAPGAPSRAAQGSTSRSASHSASRPGARPGAVRIIGGQWKRTPLPVPDLPGLRPTPDRVRETLFNWLGPSIAGIRCLDLFAGTGALGLEAASRGAADVTLVETDPRAADSIAAILRRLDARQCHLLRSDALSFLQALDRPGSSGQQRHFEQRPFDLVLLDPPFGQGWLERVLPRLAPHLAEGARLYLEHEAALDSDRLAQWLPGRPIVRLRTAHAGQVHYHLVELGHRAESIPGSEPDPSPPSSPLEH